MALACVAACGSSEACTELGCDNEANIAFTGSRPEGPYDLIVQTDGGTFMARCADPTAPEVADNDPELQCTLNSFSLVGDAATGHSVFATIVPVGMDPLVENAEVDNGRTCALLRRFAQRHGPFGRVSGVRHGVALSRSSLMVLTKFVVLVNNMAR